MTPNAYLGLKEHWDPKLSAPHNSSSRSAALGVGKSKIPNASDVPEGSYNLEKVISIHRISNVGKLPREAFFENLSPVTSPKPGKSLQHGKIRTRRSRSTDHRFCVTPPVLVWGGRNSCL